MKSWSVKPYVVSILAMTAISIFPAMFLYFKNADVAYFYETLYPSGVFLGLAAVYFLICLVFMRSFTKSAFAACLFILVIANYRFIDNTVNLVFFLLEGAGILSIAPMAQLWHSAPIVFSLLMFINYLIKKYFSENSSSKVLLALSIAFCGLIFMNAVLAVPKLSATTVRQSTDTGMALNYMTNNSNDLHPNIYYFIFDEYASFDSIKKYFDYDNSAFAEFLEGRGFTVSYDSYNLGSGLGSHAIIGNLMALEYKWPPFSMPFWYNNPLFHLVESYGYDVIGICEAPEYFGLSKEGLRRKSETMDGHDFAGVLLGNTMLRRFINVDYKYIRRAERILGLREYLRTLSPRPGNTFTLSYAVSPHGPFLFDKDGNVKYQQNIGTNVSHTENYREQYIFITKLMQEIADTIVEKDSESVIIFQSDHGQRYLNVTDTLDRFHILNAVYFKGEPIPEIRGQSGVNTLRIVLSKLFGIDLPILPVPEGITQ